MKLKLSPALSSASTLVSAFLISLSAPSCNSIKEKNADKFNVLIIICDDLNDWVEGMGGHPQARTPNIAALAQSGIMFTNAHCNDPVCAPSRASLFTGIYPHTSGLYSFENWMKNPLLENGQTIMEQFHDNGYRVYGTGKLLHHDNPSLYDEFGNSTDYGPFAFNGKVDSGNYWSGLVAHPSVSLPFRSAGMVDGSFAPLSDVPDVPPEGDAPGYKGWWAGSGPFRYINEVDRDLMPDEQNADWVISKIREMEADNSKKPFFLGVGFIRPHTPLHAPKKYFDMFPLDSILLPVTLDNDLEDCAPGLVNNNGYPKGLKHFRLLSESYPAKEGLKRYVQAYLACVAFVDDQIGEILSALDNSSFRENTIVILTSDNGYHLGEKNQLFKHTLWEEGTRIPYIIRCPDITKPGSVCMYPVSLIDLYPTLVDLCGLSGDTRKNNRGLPLDGYSLKSLIIDPESIDPERPPVALSAIFSGDFPEGRNIPMNAGDQHFSVRSVDWRYTLASDGGEELYDHRNDPNEWHNLASDGTNAGIKSSLKEQLLKMTGRVGDACEGNLITINNGFEDNTLEDWVDLGHSGISNDAHSGGKALIISGGDGGVQRFFPALPGDRFILATYLKKEGNLSWAGIGIDFQDLSGETIAEYALSPDITGEYKQYSMTRQAPDSTVQVEIWIYQEGTSGSLFADDVCLIKEKGQLK